MKITEQQKAICDEAITWVGTKWQHQACVKNVAADCAMLVAGIARNVGILTDQQIKDIPPYPKDWHFHQDVPLLPSIMEDLGCKKRNVKIKKNISPGDVLVFKIGRVPSHLGIMLHDGFFIHSYNGGAREVVINSLSAQWVDRLVNVYKLPGVK